MTSLSSLQARRHVHITVFPGMICSYCDIDIAFGFHRMISLSVSAQNRPSLCEHGDTRSA
jgi:hypothetical protein